MSVAKKLCAKVSQLPYGVALKKSSYQLLSKTNTHRSSCLHRPPHVFDRLSSQIDLHDLYSTAIQLRRFMMLVNKFHRAT